TPLLHHSTTPLLHYSTTPPLHHSTTPLLHYSTTPCLKPSPKPPDILGEDMSLAETKPPVQRILVVDDEPFVCESVKLMLAYDGHAVETAANGKEALAKYDPALFDLVIT